MTVSLIIANIAYILTFKYQKCVSCLYVMLWYRYIYHHRFYYF